MEMDALLTTYVVNTMANVMANQLDEAKLAIVSAVLTQLADTLETIAIQRAAESPANTSQRPEDSET